MILKSTLIVFISLILFSFFISPCYIFNGKYEERRKEISDVLCCLPKDISKSIIIEYDSGVNYEYEYSHVIQVLNQKASPLDFYKDDFIIKLNEHLQHLLSSPLTSSMHLNNDFYNNIRRLVFKWIIFKFIMKNDKNKNGEHDENYQSQYDYAMKFENFLSFHIKNDNCSKQLKNEKKENGNDDCLNEKLFQYFASIQCIEQWDSLFPIVKSIYKDFYQTGNGHNYIYKKYLQSGIECNIFLALAIDLLDDFGDLANSLHSKNNNTNNKSTPILLSADQINQMVEKNSFIIVENNEMLNDQDLRLVIENNHKLSIDNYGDFIKIAKMYKNIGLLTRENLFKSLLINNQPLEKSKIFEELNNINIASKEDWEIHKELVEIFMN